MKPFIRLETAVDYEAISLGHQAAFGGVGEANLVDELRNEGMVAVSCVAEWEGEIVGHILFSRVKIHTTEGTMEALSLAPMSVEPNCQRQGIGTQLVEAGLDACRKCGHQIVLVLGHPEYYPRFGFSSQLAARLPSVFGGEDAWMALELVPGALANIAGQVEFSLPFLKLI